MDREALILRNQRMAAAFHGTPLKHYLRRTVLALLAQIPKLPARHHEQQRILLIRPDHMGDVLLTTPAIHALRAALPDAEIHALVGPWSARVLASYSELDAVLTLPFPGFSRQPNDNWHAPYRLAFQAARHLRRIAYSSAIILRPDHWWGAMVSAIANIPQRIGYDLPDTAPFLTHSIKHQQEHAVLQGLRLLQPWLGATVQPQAAVFNFPVEDLDRSYIDSYLEEWRVKPEARIFCVHPGSGTWAKQWPEAHWARVADTLAEQLDAIPVFTGVESEFSMVKRITQRMHQRYCIIAGETHIGQLAALYDRACLVLGPDSGPLHLAAAVAAPSVTLFGPADPIEFGPWGDSQHHIVLTSDIACRPCRVLDWADDDPAYHPCMQDISIGQVLDAARRVARE